MIKCQYASGRVYENIMKVKRFHKISRKSCTFSDGGVGLDIFNILFDIGYFQYCRLSEWAMGIVEVYDF